MICTTVREGLDCPLMTKKGCSYNGGECKPIVEQCEGCQKVVENENGKYCSAVPDPIVKWKIGNCNMATHVKTEVATNKVKINPLKASKRAAR